MRAECTIFAWDAPTLILSVLDSEKHFLWTSTNMSQLGFDECRAICDDMFNIFAK